MTGDAKYILSIDNHGKALIYFSNTSTYELLQTIPLSDYGSHRSRGGAITDDHQWLVASINDEVKVFVFN